MGTYTVTIPTDATANAASLTLDAANATVLDQGTLLLNGGALTVDAGKIVFTNDQALTGGTSFTNQGTVEFATSGISLIDPVTNTGGTLQVDAGNTLGLAGATITGGTVDDGTAVTGATILVSGSSAIESASLNNGAVSIAAGAALTLDGTTVTGATITSLSTTSTTGTVNVDAGKTLTLAGTDTLTGGVLAFSLGPVQAAAGNSVLFSLVEANDLNPAANPSVTLTIQASSGSFAAISGSGVAITQNGDVVTIVGDLTDVDNALDNGITYTPVGSSNTLTLSVTDGSGDTAFRAISINTSNPALPTTTNLGANGEITNAGLMDITGAATLSSDSLFNNGGTVKVESGELLKLDDVKVYGGTVTDNGTVEVTGFNAITSGANLNIGAGDQLTIDPTATLMINGATVTGGAGATINNGTSSSGGIIGVQTSSTLSGLTIDNGNVTIAAGQTLTLDNDTLNNVGITDNGILAVNTLTLSGATITATSGGATFENNGNSISGGGQIGNGNDDLTLDNAAGTIETAGATLTVHTGNAVTNAGTFLVNGGIFDIVDAITGGGSASIQGGTFELGSTDAQALNFNSTSGGTLALGNAAGFTGAISGLVAGNTIDLLNISPSSIASTSINGSTLTVNLTSGGPLTYQIAGALTGNYFAVQNDAGSGSDLVLSPNVLAISVAATDSALGTQVGQELVATATLNADNAVINYQWQVSSNGGASWTDVSATTTGDYNGGTLSSFLQLSVANQGDLVRAVGSFVDGTGQTITATSAATAAVTDVTPEITPPFNYTVDSLTIVKGGTQVYDDTFSQAPPVSPNANGNPVEFFDSRHGLGGRAQQRRPAGGDPVVDRRRTQRFR